MSKLIPASLATLALAFGLSACGSDSEGTAAHSGSHSPSASGTPTAATASITLVDPWVKTAGTEKDAMSAVFGTLTNHTDTDITVTAATTSAAGMTQLHTTTQGSDGSSSMQEKVGGFLVPAHGTYPLTPGADHLMLMHLTGPIEAGATVTVRLSLSNGTTTSFDALAKDFSGAQESYAPSPEASHSMSH